MLRTVDLHRQSYLAVSLRAVFAALILLAAMDSLCAQYAKVEGIEVATIDANSRWGFRTLSHVNVSSPIVRLGDVVRPIDAKMGGWQRLRRLAVALVPLSGEPMTLETKRLAQLIHAAEATPRTIDWIGSRKIVVHYNPTNESASTSVDQKSIHSASRLHSGQLDPKNASRTQAPSPLDPTVAKRVAHWIERGVGTLLPELVETYAIEIDLQQSGLVPLRTIAGVTELKSLAPITEGDNRFQVTGRGIDGSVQSTVVIRLVPHPLVVVATRNLSRGDRIREGDLELQPLPDDRMGQEYLSDLDVAIGMEVRSTLRAGRPVARNQVRTPILIHRGDLIEVRVIGGGISVTTNAKAMDDGSESDLIEVETVEPRKRLLARVVRTGVVEIATRAPQVRR